MDDRIKESISALMDDEANELELQRLLSLKGEEHESLKSSWQSYHSIRDVISEDRGHNFSIDISAAVSEAIREEDEGLMQNNESANESSDVSVSSLDDKDQGKGKFKAWYAAAASVALAVLFTAQSGLNTTEEEVPTVAVNDQIEDGYTAKVNFENDVQTEAPVMIAQLDEAQARQLSRYLLRHAEHSVRGTQSGFVPLARIASVNSVGI